MSCKDLKALYNGIDMNKSGKIDFSEFVAATLSQEKLMDDKKLRRTFDYFDTDSTGKISVANLKEALDINNDAKIKEIIKQVDTNKDGWIQYTEFVNMMKTN